MPRKRFENGRLEDFGVFQKRKYCNAKCMGKAKLFADNNHKQTYRAAHNTSKQVMETIIKAPYRCAICGEEHKKLDVHHIDGNFNNNTPENLIYLCRSCHLKQHHKKAKCIICGKDAKGHGYCNKHYLRFKKIR